MWKDRPWWPKAQDWEVIKEFPAGSNLFTAPMLCIGEKQREYYGPTKWPVRILYRSSLATPPQLLGIWQNLNTIGFNEAESLYIVEGTISGEGAKILIDSGASRDFISKKYADKFELPSAKGTDTTYVAKLANGKLERCNGVALGEVTLGSYTERRGFTVTNLEGFDAILGLPWLRKHNPSIDWTERTMELTAEGVTQRFDIREDPEQSGRVTTTKKTAKIAVLYTDIVKEDVELLNKIKEGYLIDPYYTTRAGKPPDKTLVETPEGLWYKRGVLAIPDYDGVRTTILQEVHNPTDAGHPGVTKTMTKIARMCWWPGLRKDVGLFIRHCDECQKKKFTNLVKAGLLKPIPPPTSCFQRVSMDLITHLPLTRKGSDSIIVFVCMFSKMVIYVPIIKTIAGAELAKIFIREVYSRHGLPKALISDRDPRFTGNFWQSFLYILGTRLNMTTAYHPEDDG